MRTYHMGGREERREEGREGGVGVGRKEVL